MAADRVFKGATRPAVLLGVPIVPLVLVEGTLFLLALWLFLLVSGFAALVVAALGVLALLIMRLQTREDDQRLRQLGLKARLRSRSTWLGNHRHWGSFTCRPIRRHRDRT
jgi:type IV secretory pathway VirB3-like protein